jgi:hypothetical protein
VGRVTGVVPSVGSKVCGVVLDILVSFAGLREGPIFVAELGLQVVSHQ